MRLKKIKKLFERGNVCVFGLRGKGKDVLFGNVCSRIKSPYVSNLDYTNDERFIPFNPMDFDCGKNTYKDFVSNDLKPYVFPFAKGTHLYISDVGIYFPSQFCNELNRDYKYFPTYFALSRQLAQANVHINVQSLNRCWDKIREQAESYVFCKFCRVLFGKIVIMLVTVYDRYESALARVPPFSLKLHWRSNKETRMMYDLEKQRYQQTYGKVKNGLLIFWNKSKHDTYYFEGALNNEENTQNSDC